MLTVKVPWRVEGSQAVKRSSVMDLGVGLVCVMSSIIIIMITTKFAASVDPFASLRRPDRFWSLPTPTKHTSRRDPTVNAVLQSSGTLAPLVEQSNKL